MLLLSLPKTASAADAVSEQACGYPKPHPAVMG